MISILIADEFYLSRSGLVSILSNQPDFNILCQTANYDRLEKDIQLHRPDVTVIDIRQHIDGIGNIIENHLNGTKYLLLTDITFEPFSIIHLLRVGAHGCIQINMGEEYLIQSIRDVATGKSPLSPAIASQILEHLRKVDMQHVNDFANIKELSQRENLILNLMYEGLPNKIIGTQLGISERTVEAHVRNILKKMNASSRTQAVFIAINSGWLNHQP